MHGQLFKNYQFSSILSHSDSFWSILACFPPVFSDFGLCWVNHGLKMIPLQLNTNYMSSLSLLHGQLFRNWRFSSILGHSDSFWSILTHFPPFSSDYGTCCANHVLKMIPLQCKHQLDVIPIIMHGQLFINCRFSSILSHSDWFWSILACFPPVFSDFGLYWINHGLKMIPLQVNTN